MANFNFNKVILGGRLTADPELKTPENAALRARIDRLFSLSSDSFN